MHGCYYNISTIDEHLCLSPWELGTKPVQMTVMWYDWKLYGLLNRLQGAIMSAVSLMCDLMTQKNNVTVRLEHSMWPNVYGEQSYCYNTRGHLNRHVFRHFWVYCGEPHPTTSRSTCYGEKNPSCLIPLNSWFLRLSVRSELFVCGGKLPARQEHETEIRLTLSLQKQALQGLLIKLEQISSQMLWRPSRFNKNQFIITCQKRRVKKCVVSFTREITSISFYLQ